MSKKIKSLFLGTLLLAFLTACSNLTNPTSYTNSPDSTSNVSVTLPYGNGGRTADDNARSYTFDVVFTHQNGKSDVIRGHSGETVTLQNAPKGNYSILVMGYEFEQKKYFSGKANTTVYGGRNSFVSITLDPDTLQDLPVIEVFGSGDEFSNMIHEYVDSHPECGFNVKLTTIENTNNYSAALEELLKNGSTQTGYPDLFSIETQSSAPFVTGKLKNYTVPYENLGIDVEKGIQDAQIFDYIVNNGRDNNGKIRGLGYQSAAGGFIYRRDIAKRVFGTDDPDQISQLIGAQTGKWDKFVQAAQTLATHDYKILYSLQDMWLAVAGGAKHPYMQGDGKTVEIPEQSIDFLNAAYELCKNDGVETASTSLFSDEWSNSFLASSNVMGFFGPAWLIDTIYSYMPQIDSLYGKWGFCRAPVDYIWGGSLLFACSGKKDGNGITSAEKVPALKQILEHLTLDTSIDGQMYNIACSTIGYNKDTPASLKVMNDVDGKSELFGNQNIFEYFIPATKALTADSYFVDSTIENCWNKTIKRFFSSISPDSSELDLEAFIEQFKEELQASVNSSSDVYYELYPEPPAETTHIKAEPYENGIKFTLKFVSGDEKWIGGYIGNNYDGTALFFTDDEEDSPNAQNPQKVVYYPVNLVKDRYYNFDFHLNMGSWDKPQIIETVRCKAGGGKTYAERDTSLYHWDTGRQDSIVNVTMEKNSENGAILATFKAEGITDFIQNWDSDVTEKSFDYEIVTTNSAEDTIWESTIISDKDNLENLREFETGRTFTLSKEAVQALNTHRYYFADIAIRFKVRDLPGYFRFSPFFSPNIEIPKDDIAVNGIILHPYKAGGIEVSCIPAQTDESTGKTLPASIKITLPEPQTGDRIDGGQVDVGTLVTDSDGFVDFVPALVKMHFVPGHNEYLYPFIEPDTVYEFRIYYNTKNEEQDDSEPVHYTEWLNIYNENYTGYDINDLINKSLYDKIAVSGSYSEDSGFTAQLTGIDFNNDSDIFTNTEAVTITDKVGFMVNVQLGNPYDDGDLEYWEENKNLNKYSHQEWKQSVGETGDTSFGTFLKLPFELNRKDENQNLILPDSQAKQNYNNFFAFQMHINFVLPGFEKQPVYNGQPEDDVWWNYEYGAKWSQAYQF